MQIFLENCEERAGERLSAIISRGRDRLTPSVAIFTSHHIGLIPGRAALFGNNRIIACPHSLDRGKAAVFIVFVITLACKLIIVVLDLGCFSILIVSGVGIILLRKGIISYQRLY